MARRRASRSRSAKAAGAFLIALALLIGVSVIPPQTGQAPRFIAGGLGAAVGAGLPVLPLLCFFIGLIFFVRESFRLSVRIYGLVLGYAVALVLLHLRYPPGREFVAAHARLGGGWVGAVATASVRRWLGEPGLWLVAGLGVLGACLLLWNRSLTDVLRAGSRSGRLAAGPLLACVRDLTLAAAAVLYAAVSRVPGVLQRGMENLAARGRTAAASISEAWRKSRLPRVPEPAGARWDASDLAPVAAPAGEASRLPSVDRRGDLANGEEPAGVSVTDTAVDADNATPGSPVVTSEDAGGAVAAGSDASRGPGAGRRRKKPVIEQELLQFPVQPRQGYVLPQLSLLDTYPSGMARAGRVDPHEVARNLERTLASFGVEARVVRWETGPVVTRFELQPAAGVKVQRITSLQNDIALALAASSVRLEAPIPGKAAIGVELPNERPGLVHLREILMSPELQQSPSPLTVSVGKAIAGHPIVADLVAMPHLLIAGATGAGKSVALNAMIATLLFRATPEQVRFLMIDPKRVELTNYNGIPHLLSPVVTGPREAAAKLKWAIQEMESRYALFATEGVRNIQAFNTQHPDRPLAFIVIIIDELADLMMVAPKDFEAIICRLAQMTRAVGIHLLVATQRPSVDVITGLIKANIPSRIAFAVSSHHDSRTILDHDGAEKLLGRGDMLFAPIGATRPMRVQGSYISDAESQRLVEFWRAQGQPEFDEELIKAGEETVAGEGEGDDTLLADAARLVVGAGFGSVSMLQRKMRIGYVRAARLVDQMEEKGIVGPSQGSNPREVLAGLDDVERILKGGRAGRAGDSRAGRAGDPPAKAESSGVET
jgi:S-DNA-T family DNA segregation ATPase FtsK/SpoIIIE